MNVQNNSNNSSALCNTLLGSDSVYNPNIYSTKPIVPPHALTYSKMSPSNGSIVEAGGTTNFMVNKYGIISQMLLSYEKRVVNTAATVLCVIPQSDILSVIEKIELMSSSRTISTLTRFDLAAQISDLPEDKSHNMKSSAYDSRGGVGVGGTDVAVKYTLPLVWGLLQNQNTQLMGNFLEPISIKVTWGANLDTLFVDATATAALVPTTANLTCQIQNCNLAVRYVNYPEESYAKILANNFSRPSLNQLSTKFYDENRVTRSVNATQNGLTMTCELKSTECVESFYFMLFKSQEGGATLGSTGPIRKFVPHEIESIKFSGSGQEFFNLDKQEMAYARLGKDGFSWGQSTESDNQSRFTRIQKYQMGCYDTYQLENTLSLREVNNPLLEITFNHAQTGTNYFEYTLVVVENCSAIYAISSATGAMNISLSN
jgi:hypothetical protein